MFKNIFNDKIFSFFYLSNIAIIFLCAIEPSMLMGVGITFLIIANICLITTKYTEKHKNDLLKIEEQKAINQKALIDKALPPHLVAMPSNERTISIRDLNPTDKENGNIILSFRLIMPVKDINKLEEYRQYLKDGISDVLKHSPLYFQMTEEQCKKYQIFNFTK